MTQACPINERRINERVTRLNALITLLFLFVYLLYPTQWLLIFLMADFMLRIFQSGKYSFSSNLSKLILNGFNVSPVYINAGPKVFAAKIGLFMTAAIFLFYLLGWLTVATILAGLVILFAFLETAFGICVACKMYPFYTSIFSHKSEDNF
jgi:hypothetical protein